MWPGRLAQGKRVQRGNRVLLFGVWLGLFATCATHNRSETSPSLQPVLCGTGGQPPFYGNCTYGTNSELRGYQAGRYLDRYMFATQAEYRLVLPWRYGLVAFGGLGEVAPGVDSSKRQILARGGDGDPLLTQQEIPRQSSHRFCVA